MKLFGNLGDSNAMERDQEHGPEETLEDHPGGYQEGSWIIDN
jgi:hypothetical protein